MILPCGCEGSAADVSYVEYGGWAGDCGWSTCMKCHSKWTADTGAPLIDVGRRIIRPEQPEPVIESKKMFTILVPTERRVGGKPYRTRYHRVWDAKVREITGGLTIMPPSKGQWVAPDGTLYAERMIPVMIVATEDECDKIMRMTLDYYDQLAILCWEVSANVKMLEKTDP